METDVNLLLENIESCYDFRNKSVIHVGGGGGQIVGYGAAARSVLAVDADPEGVRRLGGGNFNYAVASWTIYLLANHVLRCSKWLLAMRAFEF